MKNFTSLIVNCKNNPLIENDGFGLFEANPSNSRNNFAN